MMYKVSIKGGTDPERADRIMNKAVGYVSDVFNSLQADETLKEAGYDEIEDLRIYFTDDETAFDDVSDSGIRNKSQVIAVEDGIIYVSPGHFRNEWERNEGLRDAIRFDLRQLNHNNDDEVIDEYMAICLANEIILSRTRKILLRGSLIL